LADPERSFAEDRFWPVARVLAQFLSTLGAALMPNARRILDDDDDTWK
jgi:hypothetical protein